MDKDLENELIGILEKACVCKNGPFIQRIITALIPFIEKCESEQCSGCVGRAE